MKMAQLAEMINSSVDAPSGTRYCESEIYMARCDFKRKTSINMGEINAK